MSHPDVTERQRLQSNMFNFNMLLSALTLTLLAVSVESWLFGSSSSSGSSPTNFNYPDNLSGSKLTDLYNSPVRTAEVVERPLNLPFPFSLMPAREPISHSGVRLTLENGEQWLAHKGPDFGVSSQTVVTRADNMSPRWRETGDTRQFDGTKTVADFVKAGGDTYNLGSANCHDAKDAMMNQ